MKISDNGINLIKQFEGCRLDAYKCPAGVWTIGYGHTGDVRQGQKITAAQAEAYLRVDLGKFEKKVEKYSKYNWNQDEFDALVSFAYNVGSIDQLTANGTRGRAVIADRILAYNKAGGKVLAGLTRRRKAERELFLKKAESAQESGRTTLKMGSRGTDVTYLQQRLTARGYGVGAIDGVFGIKTLEAVRAFQAENNLVIDGIAGPKTWEVLENKAG
jgi:Phage-related lysozyme (muraminidase)